MNQFKASLRKVLTPTVIFAYILHYALNFLSTPFVSYSFLLITGLTFLFLLTEDFENSFLVLIAYAFIEGQGRVLFSYNFLFRIIFDLFCSFLILRMVIINKKLLKVKSVPHIFIVFFVLHVLWFIINLFNPTGAAPIYAFAAVKYYILPFFLFFSFLSTQSFRNPAYTRKIGILVISLTIMTSFLCLYQMLKGETSVQSISHNYVNLFVKYEGFTGLHWRPWGTGHAAGIMSMYLSLTFGFIFLFFSNKSQFKHYLFFFFILTLSWIVLYFSQVRAFMIRHALIFIGLFIAQFLFSQKRKKLVLISGAFGLMLAFLSVAVRPDLSFISNAQNQIAAKRFLSLFDSKITKSRSSPEIVFERISTQTNWPFGYGPGMVTNFLPQIEEHRQQLTWLNKVYLWSGDNFLIFTFLELGIGALFYLGLFLIAPLTIFIRMLKMETSKYRVEKKTAFFSLVVLSVIILGNWGGVGLSFNPESFFFWMWAAIGWEATAVSLKDG